MAEPDDIFFLYVPCADVSEAAALARRAVTAQLAGCANILPGMQSIYPWQGALAESHEALLILKTSAARRAALEAEVAAHHSYAAPCVASLKLAALNAPYRQWLLGVMETP